MSKRGILIAVEGIDGAGKTTQVNMLYRALKRAGVPVGTGRLSPAEELETFIKDRTEHVEKLIAPHLAAGEVVILDRYFYSTIAYQGARGADVPTVSDEMHRLFPTPDAVYLLDVEPLVGIHRIANDRGEEPNHFEDRDSLGQARAIFNQMRDESICRINGVLSIVSVHEQIMGLFVDGPLRQKRCAKEYGCDDPFHCSFRYAGTCEWWNIRAKLSTKEPALSI